MAPISFLTLLLKKLSEKFTNYCLRQYERTLKKKNHQTAALFIALV
jgi:hypothetical protein